MSGDIRSSSARASASRLRPTTAIDPDCLLKNADMALYRAKEDGRGIHRYFEPDMDARMQAGARWSSICARPCARRIRAVLPAARAAGNQSGQRARGAAAMAAPATRIGSAGRVHPAGGRHRSHRARSAHWVLKRGLSRGDELAERAQGRRQPVSGSIQERNGGSRRGRGAWRVRPAASRLELEITETVLLQDTEATMRDADQPARPRRQHLDGRFRHGLFQPELSAEVSVRQDQDRPFVHSRFVRRAGFDRHHSRRRRPRQQPRHSHDGRRGRDRSSSCNGSGRKAAPRFRAICSASRYQRIRCSSCCNGSILRIKQWPDLELAEPGGVPIVSSWLLVPRSDSCGRPVEENNSECPHLRRAAGSLPRRRAPRRGDDDAVAGADRRARRSSPATSSSSASAARSGRRWRGSPSARRPASASSASRASASRACARSSRPAASNASRPICSTASRSRRCRSSPTWCSWPAASSAPPATRT